MPAGRQRVASLSDHAVGAVRGEGANRHQRQARVDRRMDFAARGGAGSHHAGVSEITATSVRRSTLRKGGKSHIQIATTPSVPRPPTMTAGMVPNSAAVNPDSNSPNSFDAPTNSMFTALTRPRITSGVAN